MNDFIKFQILYYILFLLIANSACKVCRIDDQWCHWQHNEYWFSVTKALVSWFNAVSICRSYGKYSVLYIFHLRYELYQDVFGVLFIN